MALTVRQLWYNFKRPHVLSKLFILLLISAVFACYLEVYPWIFQLGNHHQMVLVHVTCGSLLAITGSTWIGFLAGRDTPRYLTMIQAAVAAIFMFSVTGVCFASYAKRNEAKSHYVIPGYHSEENLNDGALLAASILSLFSAFAYIGDIGVVVYTSR